MTFWTEDKIKTLAEMWGNEATSYEIGSTLGCSRSAAMGKIRRMGLVRTPGIDRLPDRPKFIPTHTKRACEFFLPNGEMCGDDIYKRSFCEDHYKICYLPGTSREERDRQARLRRV